MVTTTKTASCSKLTCLNGGKFNSNTCSCECTDIIWILQKVKNKILIFFIQGYTSYTGSICETVLCSNADPAICNSYAPLDCVAYSIFYTCPRFCGLCKGITTTTTSACIPYACLNGGTFNRDTCSCKCYPSYNGKIL